MKVTKYGNKEPIGLAGCSIDLRISYGACKLARTPRITKKKIAIKSLP